MDLTPDLLLEAKFAPARRGYDMNEVDDFLERCAEGLDVLLARLRAEFDRAERAEAALPSCAPAARPPGPDAHRRGAAPEAEARGAPRQPATCRARAPARVEEPMRILIAAERTAEAAIADARAEAERIRAEAESVASTTRSEAETLLARSRAEAEAEARKAGDEARRSIETEVLALRKDRDVLVRGRRAPCARWLDDQRARLRTTAQRPAAPRRRPRGPRRGHGARGARDDELAADAAPTEPPRPAGRGRRRGADRRDEAEPDDVVDARTVRGRARPPSGPSTRASRPRPCPAVDAGLAPRVRAVRRRAGAASSAFLGSDAIR